MFYFLQGRDTPSPVETPYLCRQRNNANSTQPVRGSQVSEIQERGALLACANHVHEMSSSSVPPKEQSVFDGNLHTPYVNEQRSFI